MYRNQKKYEQFNIIVMVNLTIVNNSTAVRANVIAIRTNSIEIGLLKAMMIENLKEKMKNGIAHFIFQKKMVNYESVGVQHKQHWQRQCATEMENHEKYLKRQLFLM